MKLRVHWIIGLSGLALQASEPPPSVPAEEAAEPAPPSLEELYESGRVLFEVFAPEEIKAEFDFPSREQWDEFAARLQQALANDRLEDLAEYEAEARGALTALRAIPGGEEYADWLAERLDYIEAAKQTATAPVPPPPPIKPGPPAPVIPHFDLWVGRMQARPVPAGAEKLLPLLRRVFMAEGLPPELVWLAEAESTFNPGARSPAGARGLFQLMPATAKELGLSTFLPDERTDPEKSARAAAQLLKKLHARFGDWPLALAAYNAGAGRVQRTLDKQGGKTFADIASALPSETRMYVPKVLATLQVRAGLAPDKL